MHSNMVEQRLLANEQPFSEVTRKSPLIKIVFWVFFKNVSRIVFGDDFFFTTTECEKTSKLIHPNNASMVGAHSLRAAA